MLHGIARALFAFGPCLILAACAGSQSPTPAAPAEATSDAARFYGGGMLTALPVSLLLVGFDADRDLLISEEEMSAGAAAAFAAADADGSGDLGLIELGQWSKAWMGDEGALPGRFDFDRDRNNRVSREEWDGAFARLFDRFDEDDDGSISRSELLIRGDRRFGRERPRPEGEPTISDRPNARPRR